MKKRVLSALLALLLLSLSMSLFSCADPRPEEGTVTRMTVDINPSVEFIVDDENKIASVTALNDDGSVLIVGETFVGKTPEEAVELMVTLAADTGYLVKGNVEAGENTVKISVSGNSKYAEKLMENVESKADAVMKKLHISGAVEKVEALAEQALRELALSTSLYTEEEINAMDEDQLYRVIAEGRVETALLLTREMREAYHSAKEYEISFARSEETAKVIESMGGLYTITHTAYKTALDLYSTAITELDAFRYDMLVSPESQYQKSLTALREAKTELLRQRTYIASLELNGTEYASASATLQIKEEDYNRALAAYEALGAELDASLSSLITTLKQAEASLRELENTLFDANIKETLQEKAVEIEEKLNTEKDAFFAKFEEEHAADLEAVEAALLAKKQQLKNDIAAGGNTAS